MAVSDLPDTARTSTRRPARPRPSPGEHDPAAAIAPNAAADTHSVPPAASGRLVATMVISAAMTVLHSSGSTAGQKHGSFPRHRRARWHGTAPSHRPSPVRHGCRAGWDDPAARRLRFPTRDRRCGLQGLPKLLAAGTLVEEADTDSQKNGDVEHVNQLDTCPAQFIAFEQLLADAQQGGHREPGEADQFALTADTLADMDITGCDGVEVAVARRP